MKDKDDSNVLKFPIDRTPCPWCDTPEPHVGEFNCPNIREIEYVGEDRVIVRLYPYLERFDYGE